MTTASWAALLAALGASLPTAGLIWVRPDLRRRWIPGLVAFAAGTLLAAATIDLLPEAFARPAAAQGVAAAMLAGLLGFVALDLLLGHRHGHGAQRVPRQAGAWVLLGDGLHNFTDGIALAAAFALSRPAGIAATIAVLAHELPQQLSNVALLIEAGWRPRTAFLSAAGVNLSAVAGAAAAGGTLAWAEAVGPYLLALASAGFLYVAAADPIPTLQRGSARARAWDAGPCSSPGRPCPPPCMRGSADRPPAFRNAPLLRQWFSLPARNGMVYRCPRFIWRAGRVVEGT